MNDIPENDSQDALSVQDDDSIIMKNEAKKDLDSRKQSKPATGWGAKFATIKEMMLFFGSGKRWWMAPLVLLLGIIGLVLVILQSFEYVAPFIYVAF